MEFEFSLEIFAFICMAMALVGLFIRVEFLQGRVDKQSQMIGHLIQAHNRLEQEVHTK